MIKSLITRTSRKCIVDKIQQCFTRSASLMSDGACSTRSAILRHTELTSTDHLTPELQLNLITKNCALWTAKPDQCPFADPFWAFYWPGGQALTRYILDNPETVRGRRVVDIGSGCGAAAISAAMCGAIQSTANDIDKVAACAILLNANMNRATIEINTSNIIGTDCSLWDTVLLGDMFYDANFAKHITTWLRALRSRGKTILIGDPGRHTFQNNQAIMSEFRLLQRYDLTSVCIQENSGLVTGHVWTMDN